MKCNVVPSLAESDFVESEIMYQALSVGQYHDTFLLREYDIWNLHLLP